MIHEGYYHDTDLAGVKWAWLLHWPGAISEGNGHRMLVVDPSTTDAQREAMIALTNGTEGHPFFEIFASMTPHVHDPAVAEINVTYDAKERTAHLVIEGLAENTIEPILTPQGPKRVRIDMPDGFEFTISEIANSTAWSVDGPGPLAMRHEATYSQLSRMEWASDGSTR